MSPAILDFYDDNFSQKFIESLSTRGTGFAVIQNHPIPQKLIKKVHQELTAWFANDESLKEQYLFDVEKQHGYFPMMSENAKGRDMPDLKEMFQIYLGHPMPPKLESVLDLRFMLEGFALRLLDRLGQAKIEGNPYFENLMLTAFGSKQTMMRAIHYPPKAEDAPHNAVRAAAHEDINLITLLIAASEPGLEAQDSQGNWHKVNCEYGNIVVNAGDMLKEISEIYKNGKPTGEYFYTSTPHRVVNPLENENVSRISVPLFVHPHADTKLSHRYTQESYLNERLVEIGLKKAS